MVSKKVGGQELEGKKVRGREIRARISVGEKVGAKELEARKLVGERIGGREVGISVARRWWARMLVGEGRENQGLRTFVGENFGGQESWLARRLVDEESVGKKSMQENWCKKVGE